MLKAPGFTPSSDAGAASAPGAPRGGSHPRAGPQQQETAGRGHTGRPPTGRWSPAVTWHGRHSALRRGLFMGSVQNRLVKTVGVFHPVSVFQKISPPPCS